MWICKKCETYNNNEDSICCVCGSVKDKLHKTEIYPNEVTFSSSINAENSSKHTKAEIPKPENKVIKSEEVKHYDEEHYSEKTPVYEKKSEALPEAKDEKSIIAEYEAPLLSEEIDDISLNFRMFIRNRKKQKILRSILIAANILLLLVNIFVLYI